MVDDKIKVLFVCMGNICRSPAAEGTFRHLVNEKGYSHLFDIDSAGTHAYHVGESPNINATKAAAKQGVILEGSARQFTSLDFADYDYIFPMDEENLSNVYRLARNNNDREKVYKFRYFDPQTDVTSHIPDVPDPYYGGSDGFDFVQQVMNRTADNLLNYLLERHHQ